MAALSAQGHPGRTDAEGCHAGTEPRHCHGSKQSERPAQTNPGAPARDTGRPAPRKTASEEEYNRRFCATVNGEMETRHGYTNASGRSYTQVDCETNTTVYEGGLDKRSSLDSLQQALFFPTSTVYFSKWLIILRTSLPVGTTIAWDSMCFGRDYLSSYGVLEWVSPITL